MTLHLACAFQVIKLPNERVVALFHHFFLQFLHVAESVKHHNFKTPNCCGLPEFVCLMYLVFLSKTGNFGQIKINSRLPLAN